MATAGETSVLTVAKVRGVKGRATEYLFNERQRIYAIAGRATVAKRLLVAALKARQPVRVTLDARRGLIQRVSEPTPRDLEKFVALRVPLEAPSKAVRIDVSRIDPTTFNFVDLHLKWPVFARCKRIVPSYTKAKQIFDFCAKLSCHLPGPPAVPPCIPFQYVIDGCYARAHQMRRIIISKRFGYCCEKVFSFANQGNDRLAVTASKWGGRCVTWWYHVAPLIRVRLGLRAFRKTLVVAMVIDPGMFDAPVFLSTWLAAQENLACHANANVSMYSIQPGSAYWPTNYAGTTYGTDPNYTLTEGTLLAYSGLTTCP